MCSYIWGHWSRRRKEKLSLFPGIVDYMLTCASSYVTMPSAFVRFFIGKAKYNTFSDIQLEHDAFQTAATIHATPKSKNTENMQSKMNTWNKTNNVKINKYKSSLFSLSSGRLSIICTGQHYRNQMKILARHQKVTNFI